MPAADPHATGSDGDERAAYQTFALLSTLSVVTEWAEAQRLSGTAADPTTLEPAPQARREALSDAATLTALAYRLRTSEIVQPEAGFSLAYRMNRALLLRRMGRAASRLHQRLLSLFPRVDAHCIEAVRALESQRRRLDSDPDVAAYAERCLSVATEAEDALLRA